MNWGQGKHTNQSTQKINMTINPYKKKPIKNDRATMSDARADKVVLKNVKQINTSKNKFKLQI